MENRGISPVILNLGFWSGPVVRFMPWLLWLQERTPVLIQYETGFFTCKNVLSRKNLWIYVSLCVATVLSSPACHIARCLTYAHYDSPLPCPAFFIFFFFFFHWHYSPLWALACQTMSFHFFLSATNSLHLLTPSTWRALSTSSFHPFLGLPLLLVPSSSWVKIFLGILSSFIFSRPAFFYIWNIIFVVVLYDTVVCIHFILCLYAFILCLFAFLSLIDSNITFEDRAL